MFYSVASPDWTPGRPLSPSGALLFRTRAEAEAFAPDARGVAVAVRFDAAQGEVRAQRASVSASSGRWKASAVANSLGGLTVFGTIPSDLVRPVVEAEMTGLDPSHSPQSGFGGWDSLTMALLA